MDRFWNTYQEYIRSYLPEWRYDPAGGEPESAVLLAAAELIEDSWTRLASLPQKQELAFLEGWELKPLDADPMYAYASLTSPEGGPVRQGAELYMSGDGGRLWQTAEDTQAEPAELKEQFLTGGGKTIRLPSPASGQPARLFDFHPEGLSGPEVQFSHPDAFSSQQGCQVRLEMPGASPELLALFSGGPVRWQVVNASGDAVPLECPALEGHSLRFQLPAAPEAFALRASLPPVRLPAEPVGPVSVCTQRRELSLDLAWGGDGPCTGEPWLPFGEAPELWRTCCLSCPDALSLRGARLTVRFALSFQERMELLPGMEREPEYRPIMRRLPTPPPPIRDVWASQVLWEYWNGRIWLPIPGTEQYTSCFAAPKTETEPSAPPAHQAVPDSHPVIQKTETAPSAPPAYQAVPDRNLATQKAGVEPPKEGVEIQKGWVEARFFWPKDADFCEVEGQNGLWLRWRIARAENSGSLPRRSHGPEVAGLRVSALLEDAPVSVSVRGQTEEAFRPLESSRAPLFPPMTPEGDCWWLGFDRPPSGPLMRLYLTLQNRVPGGKLSAWEAVEGGRERPLALEDHTEGLSHSGVLALGGIQGGLSLRFGLRRWWLCLRDDSGRLARGRQFPRLQGLERGAVRLRAENGGSCRRGEPLSPLRGGTLRGVTLTDGFGGWAPEDQADLLRRARALRHNRGRCVSAGDVDELVCGRMRGVLRTRCVREDDTLYVAALLRDAACHEAAFEQYRDQIRRLLEETGALPALGLRIVVREPVFFPMGAAVWLRPAEGVPAETVRREVCEMLDRFLDPAGGHFHGDGWQIGHLPRSMEARNYLQASLPDAAVIKLLLTATAPDGRELDCSQVDSPYALPLPGSHTVHLIRREGLLCTP